ncbi:MAG: hypothetical protein KKH94_00970 [Candidatus Omnitrophica bacterium]|nr:hypothetical protein [Candidatus Omnitrophota bacterium]
MEKKIIKKAISAPAFLNEPIEYNKSFSRGIKIALGDVTLLEISGTASVNEKGVTHAPGDFAAQVKRTFDNITALLKSENASWYDVVRTRCYIKDIKQHYGEFNTYRNKFYKELNLGPFPASIAIQAHLCRPELLVEIEATAIL